MLEINQLLYTKKPRQVGNAIVVRVETLDGDGTVVYHVKTDYGNTSRFSKKEIKHYFEIGGLAFATHKYFTKLNAEKKEPVLSDEDLQYIEEGRLELLADMIADDSYHYAQLLSKMVKNNNSALEDLRNLKKTIESSEIVSKATFKTMIAAMSEVDSLRMQLAALKNGIVNGQYGLLKNDSESI